MAINPTQQTALTPTGNPNSVRDFAVSTGLVKEWNSNTAASLFESSGLGSASQYKSAGKKNSAFNMALLTKLKGGYKGGNDKKSISGSASVNKNNQTLGATNAAMKSFDPKVKQAEKSLTVPPSTEPVENKQITMMQESKNRAEKQARSDAKIAMTPITLAHTQEIANLQDSQRNARAGAEAAYAQANPYGSGSDREQFLKGIDKSYATQIENANNNFAVQSMQINQQLQDNLSNIEAKYQENVSAYQNNQAQQFKDYIAGIKMSDGSMPSGPELMDAIQTAMNSGKTFELAKAEIMGALTYAGRVEAKFDAQLNHMMNMDAKIIQSLSQGGDNELLTPSEVDQYQADYAKADIKIGMTKAEAAKAIDATPKFKLKNTSLLADYIENGFTAENVTDIENAFNSGYNIDDVVSAIPDITPEMEVFLKSKVKRI